MRILVAHPSPTVADGMAAALGDEFAAEVRTAHSPRALAAELEGAGADVTVLDVDLAPGRTVTVCEDLAATGTMVVVATRPERDGHLELLAAGVAGIAVATDGLPGLMAAVRTVREGHVHVPAHLLGAVLHEVIVDRRQEEPAPAPRIDALSPREREVLGLLGGGADTREIAARLVISPYTAKTHINRLLGKLGLASRSEAVALAVRYDVRPALVEVSRD